MSTPSRYFSLVVTLALILVCPATAQDGLLDDMQILDEWMIHTDIQNGLYHHFRAAAEEALDTRERSIAALTDSADWAEYSGRVRDRLKVVLGPFPERTPLNSRITGTLTHEGIRVEKVVFESRPGFPVTAALLLPPGVNADSPAPAVVYASGHTLEGFRSETYQRVIFNLALKGFVVLAFDPIGQGERMQYPDSTGQQSIIGGPTREHSYAGAQLFLVGSSMANLFAWDGVRAIDYLESRPEVDMTRIGLTGRSGGGTQTAQIAAIEDRVLAAAPEDYITSHRRLLESIGPQDAEQNLLFGLKHGLDHADFLLARAPKPTLVLSTTRDFFSIQGVRETVAEVKRAYEALGSADNMWYAEDDAEHASTRKNRESLYAFFQATLSLPGDSADLDVELLPQEALFATESGQLVVEGAVTRAFEYAVAPTRAGSVRAAAVVEAIGYEDVPPVEAVALGRHRSDDLIREDFVLVSDRYPIPVVRLTRPVESTTPSEPARARTVIFVHPEGKSAARFAVPLVEAGHTVLAIDVGGIGELGPGDLRGDAYNFGVGVGAYNLWFAGMLTGRSIVGRRAAEIPAVVAWARRADPEAEVVLIGAGSMGPVAIHAAAVDTSIAGVATVGGIWSYESLVDRAFYDPTVIHSAPAGVLARYDLPDLLALLGERPALVLEPKDGSVDALTMDPLPRAQGCVGCQVANGGRSALLQWLASLW